MAIEEGGPYRYFRTCGAGGEEVGVVGGEGERDELDNLLGGFLRSERMAFTEGASRKWVCGPPVRS
jgi:hypothetical protein